MNSPSVAAYRRRAQEYIEALGTIDATAAEDRAFLSSWASGISGPIVDLGCGPGQWTDFLHRLDPQRPVWGIDPVPEFISHARRVYPRVSYRQGDLSALEPQCSAGILSWYSLIHLEPALLPEAFSTLFSALYPGGSLALGFFAGPRMASFSHAVSPAWWWPIPEVTALLRSAGFSVERTEHRHDSGARPHGAIIARKPSAPAHR